MFSVSSILVLTPPPRSSRRSAVLHQRESLEAVGGSVVVLYTAECLCFQAGYQIVLGVLTGETNYRRQLQETLIRSQQVETKPLRQNNRV